MENIICPVCDNRKAMIGVECSDCQWPNYPVLGEKGDYYYAEVARAKEIFKDKCELRKLRDANQKLQLELEKEKLQREQDKLIAEKTRQVELDRIEKQQREQGKLRNKQKKRENSLIPKGKDFTIPNLGMDFVFVENGSFQMGSNDGYDDEKPVHKVTLSNNFWMGKYPVTQKEYKEIMEENPSYFKGNNNPVERVSWNDCVEFCARLTIQEQKAGRLPSGASYRLPTEAEWNIVKKVEIRAEDINIVVLIL